MIWDVLLFKFDGPRPAVAELVQMFDTPPPVGCTATLPAEGELAAIVLGACPGATWDGPDKGYWEAGEFSLEFYAERGPGLPRLFGGVRGHGDPLPAIVRLARAGGWEAYDTSTDEFLDLDAPSRAGWTTWSGARASVAAYVLLDKEQHLDAAERRDVSRRAWTARVVCFFGLLIGLRYLVPSWHGWPRLIFCAVAALVFEEVVRRRTANRLASRPQE